MKQALALLLLLATLLTGCTGEDELSRAMELRQKLLTGNGCSFDVAVTADYQENLFVFAMQCSADRDGTVSFTVTEPQTIAGVQGQLSGESGQLHFDEQVLLFDLLTDGLITPVSAPWLLIRTLRGGYIAAGGKDGELFRFEIDDSYEEDPLRLDIWLDQQNVPVAADILWDGRRVVSLTIENFRFV